MSLRNEEAISGCSLCVKVHSYYPVFIFKFYNLLSFDKIYGSKYGCLIFDIITPLDCLTKEKNPFLAHLPLYKFVPKSDTLGF